MPPDQKHPKIIESRNLDVRNSVRIPRLTQVETVGKSLPHFSSEITMAEEPSEPSSNPIQGSKIVEEEVHLTDLIPSSRQLVGCCRTVLWGVVETCVRQEALTEAGLTGILLNSNKNETRTAEEVNEDMPFLDAQKQLLSDMVDLLGIPADGNDENHSLPLQFGSKVQRSKGTKKALKHGDHPQQHKKTRLTADTESSEVPSPEKSVLLADAECLSLPVPHDVATMIEENVYLARYDSSSGTTKTISTAATTAAATSATNTAANTAVAATTTDNESSNNHAVESKAADDDDDALYPIRVLGNGPVNGR